MPISILLMAQEATKGLKSFGPKILLNITPHKKIIDYHISNFMSLQKSANIVTSIGFDSEKIVKYLSTITKNKKQINNTILCQNYSINNDGYVLSEYLRKCPDTKGLLIVPAGVLFKPNSINKNHISKQSTIFLLNKYNPNFETGCSIQDEEIKYVFFNLEHCWTECVFLNQACISELKNIIDTQNIDNKFLFEIVNMLIDKNVEFAYEKINYKKFIKINNAKETAKARSYT